MVEIKLGSLARAAKILNYKVCHRLLALKERPTGLHSYADVGIRLQSRPKKAMTHHVYTPYLR